MARQRPEETCTFHRLITCSLPKRGRMSIPLHCSKLQPKTTSNLQLSLSPDKSGGLSLKGPSPVAQFLPLNPKAEKQSLIITLCLFIKLFPSSSPPSVIELHLPLQSSYKAVPGNTGNNYSPGKYNFAKQKSFTHSNLPGVNFSFQTGFEAWHKSASGSAVHPASLP